MRNQQLTTLVNDFYTHEKWQKYANIVMVGDFNLTPWSSYYTSLTKAFSGELTDVTKRLPFLFTWKLKELPIFQAHIDHLRTTSSVSVQSLKAVTMPGSDHKAFLFTIKF